MSREHLLQQLKLPDRYERLVEHLGPEVVQLLVPPEAETLDKIERAALAISTRDEGLLIPVHGDSGVGKTTLIENLTHFLPSHFTQTLNYVGKLDFPALVAAAKDFTSSYPKNEGRVLPVNIDQREDYAPDKREMSEIKRFLRTAELPVRPSVFWPDTSAENARKTAAQYKSVAGETPIDLPLKIEGPPHDAWVSIARDTLRVANGMESLEDLGVDPANYIPNQYGGLGAFLRKISTNFDDIRFKLQKETRLPISLAIVFPSESLEPGILNQITSGGRYGLLEPHALIGTTPNSEIGRWWGSRRGLLTRAIVQLNAHALFMPTTLSTHIMRRHGSEELQKKLTQHGWKNPGSDLLSRTLLRSDFGKFLSGQESRAYEARGTPARSSIDTYKAISEMGLTQGKDKLLNEAVANALREVFNKAKSDVERIDFEKKLDFCRLIPDNSVYTSDGVLCLEYHWRSGDYLQPKNRSSCAQYILKKLRDYARQLSWTSD